MHRWSIKLTILAVGAVLAGGVGWLAGPLWAVPAAAAGLAIAFAGVIAVLALGKPDPLRLLRAGRPEEAYQHLVQDVAFTRKLAARRPSFRGILAYKLVTLSETLQALGNEPQALEAVTEAVAIYTELTAKPPGQRAGALTQQADLLAHMSRRGEALAAESAVQIYRHLAGDDRIYLPDLAEALTIQSDALGRLDRITEARTAAAEADLIRTDMLPATQP